MSRSPPWLLHPQLRRSAPVMTTFNIKSHLSIPRSQAPNSSTPPPPHPPGFRCQLQVFFLCSAPSLVPSDQSLAPELIRPSGKCQGLHSRILMGAGDARMGGTQLTLSRALREPKIYAGKLSPADQQRPLSKKRQLARGPTPSPSSASRTLLHKALADLFLQPVLKSF